MFLLEGEVGDSLDLLLVWVNLFKYGAEQRHQLLIVNTSLLISENTISYTSANNITKIVVVFPIKNHHALQSSVLCTRLHNIFFDCNYIKEQNYFILLKPIFSNIQANGYTDLKFFLA